MVAIHIAVTRDPHLHEFIILTPYGIVCCFVMPNEYQPTEEVSTL